MFSDSLNIVASNKKVGKDAKSSGREIYKEIPIPITAKVIFSEIYKSSSIGGNGTMIIRMIPNIKAPTMSSDIFRPRIVI